MGCDIHAYIEIFDNDSQRWRFTRDLDLGRDYALFGILAGVRGPTNDTELFSEARGIPGIGELLNGSCEVVSEKERPSIEYLTYAMMYGNDGHSHSYITLEEAVSHHKNVIDSSGETVFQKYYGEGSPDGWKQMIEDLKKDMTKDISSSQIRMVFFFDN